MVERHWESPCREDVKYFKVMESVREELMQQSRLVIAENQAG